MLRELLAQHREEILAIAARYGATNVRIFGSVARGDETPDSDIDLLVELGRGRSLLDLAAIQIELQELLSRPVDVATDGGIKRSRLKNEVYREAVLL